MLLCVLYKHLSPFYYQRFHLITCLIGVGVTHGDHVVLKSQYDV